MNRQKLIFTAGLLCIVLNSCKTAHTSLIIGDNYDEQKNQTTLTIFPYGSIILHDKWKKISYDKVSKQHFFKNEDQTIVALAKNPKQEYPFYKLLQSNKDFLTEFTKWESDYFKSQGATISIIDNQSDKDYILWKATIENENIKIIYLYGVKGNFAYNLSCDSKNWSDEKTQEFLIKLFIEN